MPPTRGILYALDYAVAAVPFLILALLSWVFAPPPFWREVPGLVRAYQNIAKWRLYSLYVFCAGALIVAATFALVAAGWALGIGPVGTGESPSAADIGTVANDLSTWLALTLFMLAMFVVMQVRGLRNLRRVTAQRAAEAKAGAAMATVAADPSEPPADSSGA